MCSDEYGAVTSLPKLFETLVLESIQLVKEAVLAIDNREDDILDQPAARTNTQLLLQKVSRLRTVTAYESLPASEEKSVGVKNVPAGTTSPEPERFFGRKEVLYLTSPFPHTQHLAEGLLDPRLVLLACVSDPDPDSIRSVDPYPDSESGSRSRRAKITNKNRKN